MNLIIIAVIIMTLPFCWGENLSQNKVFQMDPSMLKVKDTLEVTKYKTVGQKCGVPECLLEYYVYQNGNMQSGGKDVSILLVSGMRGDDIIGPDLIIQSYQLFEARRIIFVPYLNPSAFVNNRKNAFPGKIDMQKDFPIKGTDNCNQTAGFQLLTKLYNSYNITLSIYIHEGQPMLSYSWNSNNLSQTLPDDLGIYKDITDMLRYQNERESYSLGDKFQFGNFIGSKEDNSGYFVDWAYGAAKHPEILSKECNNQTVNADLFKNMNGLSFSLGLGHVKGDNNVSAPLTIQKYIKRGQKIIKNLLKVVHPEIIIQQGGKDELLIKLSGCKTGVLTNLKITNNKDELLYQKKDQQKILHGNVRYGLPSENRLKLQKVAILQGKHSYTVQFYCDNGWMNIGTTHFSAKREFSSQGMLAYQGRDKKLQQVIESKVEQQVRIRAQQLKTPPQKHQKQSTITTQTPSQKADSTPQSWLNIEWNIYTITIVGFIISLILIWFTLGLRTCHNIMQRQKIRNFNQKFQNIEYIEEDTFQYDASSDRRKGQQSQEYTINLEKQSLQQQK